MSFFSKSKTKLHPGKSGKTKKSVILEHSTHLLQFKSCRRQWLNGLSPRRTLEGGAVGAWYRLYTKG